MLAKRRGLYILRSELPRGDRRGLLKAKALLQRRWEAMSDLKYITPTRFGGRHKNIKKEG